MSKTIDEIINEIMADDTLRRELMEALNDPPLVAAFLRSHECEESVNDFIARLDTAN